MTSQCLLVISFLEQLSIMRQYFFLFKTVLFKRFNSVLTAAPCDFSMFAGLVLLRHHFLGAVGQTVRLSL